MKPSLRIVCSILLIGVQLAACGDNSATATEAGAATVFDVVISNGRVIDPETQLDAIRNVGIKDGLIASLPPAWRVLSPNAVL